MQYRLKAVTKGGIVKSGAKPGDIVNSYSGSDYGLARGDAMVYGEAFVCVTLVPGGEFFTAAASELEAV